MKSQLNITVQDDVTVVLLADQYDNLDQQSLEDVNQLFLELAKTVSPPLVVFDMAETQFFGSCFLGFLFRAWRRLKSRGGNMACCNANGICAQVLDVTQADKLWCICNSRESAILAVKEGRP